MKANIYSYLLYPTPLPLSPLPQKKNQKKLMPNLIDEKWLTLAMKGKSLAIYER